uniref:Uncharacterized protein n=1 Tax=Cannabis sativa TaxID=3483 RepID=A0A803P9X7_CANSA
MENKKERGFFGMREALRNTQVFFNERFILHVKRSEKIGLVRRTSIRGEEQRGFSEVDSLARSFIIEKEDALDGGTVLSFNLGKNQVVVRKKEMGDGRSEATNRKPPEQVMVGFVVDNG